MTLDAPCHLSWGRHAPIEVIVDERPRHPVRTIRDVVKMLRQIVHAAADDVNEAFVGLLNFLHHADPGIAFHPPMFAQYEESGRSS